MKARLLAVSTGAALLLGAVALPAFAATTSVDGTTGVNVSTGASTGASANTGASTGVNVSGDTGAMVNGTGAASSSMTSGQTSSSSASDNGSVGVSVGSTGVAMNGSAGATISLMSSDPSVVDYSGTTTPTASDAMSVQSQDQLNSFAAGIMHSDANIQAVNITSNDVMLSYKKEGHFLGFIPTSITEKGEVKADGTVSLSYPWYHFLVSTDDTASAQVNLQAQVQPLVSSNTNGSFSAQTQAQIVADLYTAMSTKS